MAKIKMDMNIKEAQRVLSYRTKDSGFKFFKSYIKNIELVGSRYAMTDYVTGTDYMEDFYYHDYKFEYKGKFYICKEINYATYETFEVKD